jgi:cytochrome c553
MRRHALAAIGLIGAASAAWAGAPTYGYLDGDAGQPVEVCAECHGMDGRSWSDRFPNMAAQDKAYLLDEMQHFRDGTRSNDDHQMTAVLSGLDAPTMDAIAAWYAAQPPVPPAPAELSPAQRAWAARMVTRGEGVLHGCDSCHNDARYHGIAMPRIDGERAGYLARELRDFADGTRADDPHALMRRVVHRLPPQQIDVLARYLASLPRTALPAQR